MTQEFPSEKEDAIAVKGHRFSGKDIEKLKLGKPEYPENAIARDCFRVYIRETCCKEGCFRGYDFKSKILEPFASDKTEDPFRVGDNGEIIFRQVGVNDTLVGGFIELDLVDLHMIQ